MTDPEIRREQARGLVQELFGDIPPRLNLGAPPADAEQRDVLDSLFADPDTATTDPEET